MNMRLSLKKKEMKQTDEDCLMFQIVNLFVIKTIFAVEGGLQGEVLVCEEGDSECEDGAGKEGCS